MATVSLKFIEVVCYADGRMDTHNAAKYTGLEEKTMAMQRCSGTGPKFIKRGRVFYFTEDLDAWMNADGRHTSTAPSNRKKRLAELASVG
jgi:hypothetical protein